MELTKLLQLKAAAIDALNDNGISPAVEDEIDRKLFEDLQYAIAGYRGGRLQVTMRHLVQVLSGGLVTTISTVDLLNTAVEVIRLADENEKMVAELEALKLKMGSVKRCLELTQKLFEPSEFKVEPLGHGVEEEDFEMTDEISKEVE